MGKKEYGDFVEKLRRSLQEEMDLDDDQIFFQSQAPGITELGDRLLLECVEWDKGKELCALHTRELYESYLEGRKMKAIVRDVKGRMERLKSSGFFEKAQNLGDYEKIKNDLFIRLVSAGKERDELKSVVCRVIGDVAQVLYLRIAEEDDYTTSLKIQKAQVKYWGMNEDVVFEVALMNTMRTYPPRIFRWEGLIYDRDYRGEMFMAPIQTREVHLRRTALGNCLSTSHRTNGAVAIFYPGVAARLAQMMEQDLYLVFTSVHEVMIHSASQCEVEDLETALWATLRDTTPRSEWLTLRIYRYCRATNNIICVSDGSLCEDKEENDSDNEENSAKSDTDGAEKSGKSASGDTGQPAKSDTDGAEKSGKSVSEGAGKSEKSGSENAEAAIKNDEKSAVVSAEGSKESAVNT